MDIIAMIVLGASAGLLFGTPALVRGLARRRLL